MSLLDTPSLLQEPASTLGEARLSCRLQFLQSPSVPVTVLSLAGELDTSTQTDAAVALDVALDQAPGPLVVDLAALTFCSAAGLGLLGGPTETVGGHAYALAGLSRQLDRVITVHWPADMPARYPSTAAAASALCLTLNAHQTSKLAG